MMKRKGGWGYERGERKGGTEETCSSASRGIDVTDSYNRMQCVCIIC